MGTADTLEIAAPDDDTWEPVPLMRGERRMNARALTYWQARTKGRDMPALAECSDLMVQDFAAHMALFDLSGPGRRPKVRQVGGMLAAGLNGDTAATAGSPLAEFVRRLPAISSRQSPLGFDAEFPAHDAAVGTLCLRGILLPLADETGEMAHVMGVMNWRWAMDGTPANDVLGACSTVGRQVPCAAAASAWDATPGEAKPTPDQVLGLAAAQTWVALALADRARAEHHRNAALGTIHDALAAVDDVAVRDAVRTIFTGGADAREIELYTRTILQARRIGSPAGQLSQLLNHHGGARDFLTAGERMQPDRTTHSFTLEDLNEQSSASLALGLRVGG